MLIRCKKDFYDLSEKGLCGNTPRTWKSWEEWENDSIKPEWVGIRRTINTHKRSFPRMYWRNAVLETKNMVPGTFLISEVPSPDIEGKHGLQGELTWFDYALCKAGWVFYYTHILGYMRTRLQEDGRHIYNWDVQRLIKGYCTSSEYQELMDLFDKYTDEITGRYPVIEFAVFDRPFGRLNRHLVIWEIRNGY